MADPSRVDSRFTGMIFLLARVLSLARDGRIVPISGPTMGFAVQRPPRA